MTKGHRRIKRRKPPAAAARGAPKKQRFSELRLPANSRVDTTASESTKLGLTGTPGPSSGTSPLSKFQFPAHWINETAAKTGMTIGIVGSPLPKPKS